MAWRRRLMVVFNYLFRLMVVFSVLLRQMVVISVLLRQMVIFRLFRLMVVFSLLLRLVLRNLRIRILMLVADDLRNLEMLGMTVQMVRMVRQGDGILTQSWGLV